MFSVLFGGSLCSLLWWCMCMLVIVSSGGVFCWLLIRFGLNFIMLLKVGV